MRKSFTQLFSVFALICVFGFQALAGWDDVNSIPMDENPNVNPADIATQFVVAFDDAPTISAAGGTMVVYKEGTIITTIPINNSSADVQVVEKTLVVTHGIASIDEETGYSITLSASAIDDEDGITSWDFMTGDFTAPMLVSEDDDPLSPVGASVEATILENAFELELVFDEDVLVGEGNIAIYQENGTVVELIDVTDLVHLGGATVTVPVSDDARFIPETVYYVKVDAGAFTDDVSDYNGEEDAVANDFAGILDNTTWTFTTRDNSAPEITASVSDIASTTATLSVTLSEDGSFYYVAQDDADADPTVIGDYSDAVDATAGVPVEVDLTGLTGGVKQEVFIIAENEEDPINITVIPGEEVNFNTLDNTAPMALDRGTIETDKKTTGVYIIFDEEVFGGEGLLELRKEGTNELVIPEMAPDALTSTQITSGTYEDDWKVEIDFDVELDSEVAYYVVFPKGYFVDALGNEYGDDVEGIAVPLAATDWPIEGYDFEAPVVTFSTDTKSTETSGNITGAGNDDYIYVHFDELVTLVDGNEWPDYDYDYPGYQTEWAKYLTIKKEGINVSAEFYVDGDLDDPTTIIEINPENDLASNTTYTITLRAGVVQDENGNVVEAEKVITVTTDDNDTPAYVFGPSGDLDAKTPLTITFNKDVFLVDGDDTNPLVSADLAELLTLTVDGDPAEFTAEYDAATMEITVTAAEDFPTSVCGDPAIAVTLAFDDTDVEDSQEADFDGTADNDWSVSDYTAPVATLLAGDIEWSDFTAVTITFDEAVALLGSYEDGEALADQIIFKDGSASGENLDFTAAIDLANEVITITPDDALEVGDVIYYGIGSSMEDCADNAIAASYETFTLIADPVDPTVEAVTYTVNGGAANDIDDVALDVVEKDAGGIDIVVTFDQAIDDKDLTTVNTVVTDFSTGNVTIVSGDIDGNTLKIAIPAAVELASLTTYTITVPAELVEGNASYNEEGDFAQQAAFDIVVKSADTEAPSITGTTPVDLDTEVPLDFGTLEITFDEKVVLGSGSITFTENGEASAEQTVSVSAANITLASDGMSADVDVDMLDLYYTTYDVVIDAEAFEDEAGNALVEDYEFSFDTEVNPQPEVVELSPADDADQVTSGEEIDLTIEFSEEVVQASTVGSRKLVYVVEHTGSGDRAEFDVDLDLVVNDDILVYFAYVELDKVAVSGNMITISGVELEASKNYYVMITPGAFKDLSEGNGDGGLYPVPGEFAGITDSETWNFTTSNVNAPVVELSFSDLGVDELPLKESDIIITFSKPIVKADDSEITDVEIPTLITLTKNPDTSGEVEIEFTATISDDKQTITIDNSTLVILGEMEGSTEYEVAFESGTFKVEDASINLGDWDEIFMTSDYDAPTAPSIAFGGPEVTAIDVVDGVHTADLVLDNEDEAGDAVKLYYYWTADLDVDLAAQNVMDLGTEVAVADAPKSLTFDENMASETEYRVVAIAVDAAGNMSSVTDFTYWTDDNKAPELANDLPTEFGVTDDLDLVFGEDVVPVVDAVARVIDANGVTYFADIVQGEGDDAEITVVISALALPISDDVATYTIEVDPGMIVDVPRVTGDPAPANNVNEFAGILGASFSVVSDDEVLPVLLSAVPDEEAVSLNPTFTLTFSEDVDLNDTFTQFIIFEDIDEGEPTLKSAPIEEGEPYDILTAANVSIDGNVVTLTTNRTLVSGKYYYLRIVDGTFSDIAGNVWDNDGDEILEIMGEDTLPLNVTFRVPQDGYPYYLPSDEELEYVPDELCIVFGTVEDGYEIPEEGGFNGEEGDIFDYEEYFVNPNDPINDITELMELVSLTVDGVAIPFELRVSKYHNHKIWFVADFDDYKGQTITYGFTNLYDEAGNLNTGEEVSFVIAEDALPEPDPIVFTPGDNDDDSETVVGITVDQTFTVDFDGIIYSYDNAVEVNNNLIVDAAWLEDNNVFVLSPMPVDATLEVLTYTEGAESSTVTLKVDTDLDSDTEYELMVDGSMIQLGQGNATSLGDYYEHYSTGDVDAPYLIMDGDEVDEDAYLPTNGGIAVKDDELGLVFNEEVVGTGVIEIHRWDGSLVATVDITGIESGEGELIFGDIDDIMAANDGFVSDETYYVIVPEGAVEDEAGNAFAGITVINEWTFELQDDNNPVVTFLYNGMDNVPVNTLIDLAFDREVVLNDGEMGWLAIYEEMDGDAVQLIRINNDVAPIDPSTTYGFEIDELMPNTTYYVELGKGSFILAADGETMQEQVEIGEWWFTTETNDAPLAIEFQPANEEDPTYGVLPASDLVITFDQEVQAGVGNIQLHNKLDVGDDIINSFDVTDPSQVVFAGTTVTIPASVLGLVENSEYYVIIPGSAIMNTSVTPEYYAGITVPLEWSFSTVLDGTPPALTTWTPLEETIADNHPTFTMTFDENVFLTEAGGNLVVTKVDETAAELIIPLTAEMIADNVVTVTYVYDADNADLDGLDKNTEYFVTVEAGALADETGNLFEGVTDATVWTFTTGDNFVTDNPELEQEAGFKVYPNPFDGYVTIDNADQLSRIVISNVAGQRVKDIVNPTKVIKTSELRSGIYFITLVKDDVAVKTARIVKR